MKRSKAEKALDPDAKELFRLGILIELYSHRHTECPWSKLKLTLHLNQPHRYSDNALDAELAYLLDKQFIAFRFSALGARKLYRLTAHGVDLMEREYPWAIEEPEA